MSVLYYKLDAVFLKDDKKRDWLVEAHYFTFGLTFMIAPMRNAALPVVCGLGILSLLKPI